MIDRLTLQSSLSVSSHKKDKTKKKPVIVGGMAQIKEETEELPTDGRKESVETVTQ